MATVVPVKKGHRVQVWINGKRRNIHLASMTNRFVGTFVGHVEHLVDVRKGLCSLGASTNAWLKSLSVELRAKLQKVGLLDGERPPATLRTFLDEYLAGRTDRATRTDDRLEFAADILVEFFGRDRTIESVGKTDAAAFDRYLRGKKKEKGEGVWSENTVRRQIGRGKQFFAEAVKQEIISKNPFDGIASCVRPNRTKDHFITKEVTARLIDACPDVEWKCIVGLARIAGLRVPCELVTLRWDDVDFLGNKIKVTNVKTARKTGRPFRECPLFSELGKILREAYLQRTTDYVIGRYREPGVNLRTGLTRIIEREGLKVWPKLFINMRASRATELADLYPSHVAADWCGHSEKIADAHYRQVLPSHLAAALAEQGFAMPEPGIVDRMIEHRQDEEVLKRVLHESSKCLIIIPSSFQDTAKEWFSPENDTDPNWMFERKYSRRDSNTKPAA